jgi:photosystem II stability/assembly factor-like uncharacterized protein
VIVIALTLVVIPASLRAQQRGVAPEVHHIHGLAFDRMNRDVILVATHTGLVRLKPNATPEWIGDHRFDLMGFTAHPKQATVFFASGHPDLVTYRREQVGNLGLLVSEDGGLTWRSIALRGQADFHALAYSGANGGELYGWSVAGQRGLYRIRVQTGAADRLRAEGLADVLALSASPDGASRLRAGTNTGMSMSEDGGQSWRPVAALPAGLAVSAVAHDATDARTVYAYVHGPGRGLMRSRDAGATWVAVGFVTGADKPVIALAAGPGERVAVATTAADVLRSTDGGRNWQRLLDRGRAAIRPR